MIKQTLCFCATLFVALATTISKAETANRSPFSVCYVPAGDYNVSTIHLQNVNSLLFALRPNASLTGFAAGVAGQPPNRVYGTALCFGDASSEDCRGCIDKATGGTSSLCGSRQMWYDYCVVRYSPSNFLGVADAELVAGIYNTNNPAALDRAVFNQQLVGLLSNLTAIATGSRSRLMYAAGYTYLAAGQTIHSSVQCSRDISLIDCGTCLANLTSRIQKDSIDATDVMVYSRTCIIGYQLLQPSSSIAPRVGLQWFGSSNILVAIIISTFSATLWQHALFHL
ncbi:Cysteine-rich repeat secretory protein 59 [Nymphaea thermarum]|nr:Cysteine-rich repeat secretory protein 59 [Nymphaea thermarum]